MFALSRRRFRAAVAVLTLGTALVWAPGGAAAAAPSPFGAAFARAFAAPPADAKPKIRYWWPCGEITPATIDAEVRQIADRGFGAAEVICMRTTDPAQYGWGSPALTDRLERVVEAGRKYGVKIDLTVGPAWPLVVPGLTPDSPQAAQEIAYGRQVVEGGSTYTGPVPAAPAPAAGVTKQTLVALQAVRCAGSCTAAKPVKLDKASLVDLTGSVRDGSVSWTAPSDGQWLLLGFWQRGTAQAPVYRQSVSGQPAYVVDHFSAAGVRAATGYWDAHVLTPKLRRLLKSNGGDLFEDSLELDSAQHWTWDLPGRFRDLRGYSLRENLPVLFIDKIHRQYTPVTPDDTPDFEFTDGSGERIRDDYYRTLTDLYIGEHVKPLRNWARPLGLNLRAQAYGTTIDSPTVQAALDVPETESLGQGADYTDTPAVWVAGGAVHLSGKNIYSLECCAANNNAYGQTWPQMLKHFNTAFAHGVTQIVYHGFATGQGWRMPWPGFQPFIPLGGNGFSEAWGPRQPTWDDTDEIAGWTSRMQYVLRQGRPSVDLAVYRQKYDTHHVQAPDGITGFTYDFTGPDQLDGTRVAGRRLAPDGPGYRALILDRQPTLPVKTARTLLEHARKGLPVVIVGEPPRRTPGHDTSGRQDTELAGLVERLLAQPSVRHVSGHNDLPATLQHLGVHPAAQGTAGLLSAHRTVSGGQLYYLYNPTSSAITTQVSLEGRGTPYTLDAWTGKITAAGQYRASGARTTVPVTLAPGDSTVIALDHGRRSRHVTATSGGEIVMDGRTPTLRTSRPGTYNVTFDNGDKTRVTVAGAAPAQTLGNWNLTVDDWRPGTDGSTNTTRHTLTLTEPKPWSDIPQLQDVSGVGTYTTTVRLGRVDGAYLDLGQVTDTFQVTVNGHVLPAPNQVTRRIDLAGHLKEGTNTIAIRVATPLRNRLRVTEGFPAQASQPRQQYGLIGPVHLTPYRETQLKG